MKIQIFTGQDQEKLLIVKGLNRFSNVGLAEAMHASRPTIQKMLNDNPPFVVQGNLYKRFTKFMDDHTVVANQNEPENKNSDHCNGRNR